MDKIVRVSWMDSAMLSGEWKDSDSVDGCTLAPCVSVGILVKETKDSLLLCQSTSEVFKANLIVIPKACITKREVIK